MKYFAILVVIGLALTYALLAVVGTFVTALMNLNFSWLSVYNAAIGLLTLICACALIMSINGIIKLLK
jgi:hypothetical protein